MKKNIFKDKTSRQEKKFFTIIIPCFNGQDFIMRSVKSVLDQSFHDFELIVVNDGSTDNSLTIIKSLGNQDSRISIVHHKKNRGLSAARNSGLDRAGGQYVTFLDCDDSWPKEKLKTYAYILQQGHDLVYSAYDVIDNNNNKTIRSVKVPPTLSYDDLMYSNYIPVSSAAYNFEKIPHIRFKSLQMSEDWVFWLEAIRYLNKPIGIQESLMFYYVHNFNMSANKLIMIKRAWQIFRTEQQFSFLRSSYGMVRYGYSKLKRYYL